MIHSRQEYWMGDRMQAVANGSADEAADSRWMTYTELAAARRITTSSAIKLVLRRGWRRRRTITALCAPRFPPIGGSRPVARTATLTLTSERRSAHWRHQSQFYANAQRRPNRWPIWNANEPIGRCR